MPAEQSRTVLGLRRSGGFTSPPRPVPAPRVRAGGLGSQVSEPIPSGPVPAHAGQPPGSPEAPAEFYGVRSRSRFAAEGVPPPVGHGGAQGGVQSYAGLPDPAAGRSRFRSVGYEGTVAGVIPPPIGGEVPYREERAGSLGQTGPALVRSGEMAYVRRDEASQVYLARGVERAADLIRWSSFGEVLGRIHRRFTLRREFEQGAQTFSGLRFTMARGVNVSTSPVRMRPARTNRLTERALPSSFGSATEIVGG